MSFVVFLFFRRDGGAPPYGIERSTAVGTVKTVAYGVCTSACRRDDVGIVPYEKSEAEVLPRCFD